MRVPSALRATFALIVSCGIALQGATPASARDEDPRDLSGLWMVEGFVPKLPDVPSTPEMAELFALYEAQQAKGMILYSAWTSCRPGGPSSMTMPRNSVVILRGKDDLTLSYEEPRYTRRVELNGTHPAGLAPGYMGHSVGTWDGDTLVIDTVGYNGNFQIDSAGLMTSDQLHTVERWTKSADGKRISVETTIIDPVYLAEPYVIQRSLVAPPAGASRFQNEYDCSENPREEEFSHTYYIKDGYRPTCIRREGEGMEPSKMICIRRDSEDASAAGRESGK